MIPLAIVLLLIGAVVISRRWDRLVERGGHRNAVAAAVLAVLVAGVMAYLFSTSVTVSGPAAWLLAVLVYGSAILNWTRFAEESATARKRQKLLARVPTDGAGRAEWMKAMDELAEKEMQALRPQVPTRRGAAKSFVRLVSERLASVRELRDPRTGQFLDALGKSASEWEAEERRLEGERQWSARYLRH